MPEEPDFLSPEVFDRVNTYLLQVRKKFFEEGIVAHSSFNSLRELLIKNEDVIRQLSSHDFIKSLVHLVMPDRASLLERAMGRPTALLLDMIRNRVGPFEQSVIGSPFHEICDRLTGSASGGVKLPQQALLHALKEAGWQDMGRLGSADYPNKKHIFCAPELKHYRKSDLRRMVEVADNSNSATDRNK